MKGAVPIGSKKSCNVLLLGDPQTGKTALVNQYIYKEFTEEYEPTILDCLRKDCEVVECESYVMNIVDICCDEDFRKQRSAHIRNADVVILVYSLSDKKSIQHLKHYAREVLSSRRKLVRDFFPDKVPISAEENNNDDGENSSDSSEDKSVQSKKKKEKKKRKEKRKKSEVSEDPEEKEERERRKCPYLPELRIPVFFVGTHSDEFNEPKNERFRQKLEGMVSRCLAMDGLEVPEPTLDGTPKQTSAYIPDGAHELLPLYELDVHNAESVDRAFHAIARLNHFYTLEHPRAKLPEVDEEELYPTMSSAEKTSPRRGFGGLFKRKRKSEVHCAPPSPPSRRHSSVSSQASSSRSSLPHSTTLYKREGSVDEESIDSSVRSGSTYESADIAVYTSPSFYQKYLWGNHEDGEGKGRSGETPSPTAPRRSPGPSPLLPPTKKPFTRSVITEAGCLNPLSPMNSTHFGDGVAEGEASDDEATNSADRSQDRDDNVSQRSQGSRSGKAKKDCCVM